MTENFFDEQSEQSQIKAAIVADYFWAWASVIIGTQNRYPQHAQKIAYIDLFAGPGRYQNGAASTPLMIMERAVADSKIRDRLIAIFNVKDDANSASLETEIGKISGIDSLTNYRDVLCRMEQEGKINMVPPCPPRRRGTIGKDVTITFPQGGGR